MRAETLRARKEERVRKRSRQHTVEALSQGKEEGEQLAAAPGAPRSPCPHAEGAALPTSCAALTAARPPRAVGPGRARGLSKRGAPKLGAGSPQETLASPLQSGGVGSPQMPP